MARQIEVIIDPEFRHRLGAGADWNAGSRMLAARIARRRRRHGGAAVRCPCGDPGDCQDCRSSR